MVFDHIPIGPAPPVWSFSGYENLPPFFLSDIRAMTLSWRPFRPLNFVLCVGDSSHVKWVCNPQLQGSRSRHVLTISALVIIISTAKRCS